MKPFLGLLLGAAVVVGGCARLDHVGKRPEFSSTETDESI